jgi:hypothetical protein
MATLMARGAMTTIDRRRPGAARPSRLSITLADLITAIQDVVGPEDDRLVVATVRHLMGAGRLTRRSTGTRQCSPPHQEKILSHNLTRRVRHPSAVARRWPCGQSPGYRRERGATGHAADRLSERR